MQVNILLTSGDEDEWVGCSDTINDDGMLMIITKIPSEDPEYVAWAAENMKIIVMAKHVDQGPDLPPLEVSEPYRVDAVYAPGMWMKVEFGA